MDFGAPSTAELTERVRKRIAGDEWMQSCGGREAFNRIDGTLADYLTSHEGGAAVVNFEHIFHCAQEILSLTFPPTRDAVNEFRPILYPFLGRWSALDEKTALDALVRFIPEVLSTELSKASAHPSTPLAPMAKFIDHLRLDHVVRIYTTNYDDFILQAAQDMYHGFDADLESGIKAFDAESFWTSTDKDSVFHLHGSVHFGFPSPPHSMGNDFTTLHWFDDPADPRRHVTYHGSQTNRMDGTEFIPAAVVTGFDKLSRMQQTPLAHYYASLARDAMTTDVIYVIGSGLVDLHINARLKESRHRRLAPPLLFLDRWRDSFQCETRWEDDRKTIAMFDSLNMLIVGDRYDDRAEGGPPGWTVATNGSCAVWDKGFRCFLDNRARLREVLARLRVTDPQSC